MLEKYQTVGNFNYSNRWFIGFCRGNKLPLRRKIHVSKKASSQLKPAAQKFYAKLPRERKRRTFALYDIAKKTRNPCLLF